MSTPAPARMLLRTIGAAPTAGGPAVTPLAPGELPAQVDDELLARVLRHGRPQGTEEVIELAGVSCLVTAAGQGRPLLFVHGLGHDSWDWRPLFVRCSNQHRCVALDLPGFGLSDKPAAPPQGHWGLRVHIDALLELAARLPEPPIVVASSLGGHVAILAALERPAAFAKLALLSPGGLVEVPALLQASLRAYYSVDAVATRSEAELLANTRRIFAASGLSLDDELATRKLAVRRSARAREFAAPFAGVVDDVFRHVVASSFASLRLPALMVGCERDVVVPADACAQAARRLGCRFELFAGVGHAPHLECAERLAPLLLSFSSSGGSP